MKYILVPCGCTWPSSQLSSVRCISPLGRTAALGRLPRGHPSAERGNTPGSRRRRRLPEERRSGRFVLPTERIQLIVSIRPPGGTQARGKPEYQAKYCRPVVAHRRGSSNLADVTCGPISRQHKSCPAAPTGGQGEDGSGKVTNRAAQLVLSESLAGPAPRIPPLTPLCRRALGLAPAEVASLRRSVPE